MAMDTSAWEQLRVVIYSKMYKIRLSGQKKDLAGKWGLDL